MIPNPWRGEVEIMLDGMSYMLRPTFAALSGIEQALGQGLVALAGKLAQGNITLEELAVIIAQCAVDAPPEMPGVREALSHGGLAQVMESVSRMFAAIFGGCDADG